MNEKQAKRDLERLLQSYTLGSVLHLLADLHREAADEAERADDAEEYLKHRMIEHVLFVVGLGVDAALPT
jgi:hypothetical protein